MGWAADWRRSSRAPGGRARAHIEDVERPSPVLAYPPWRHEHRRAAVLPALVRLEHVHPDVLLDPWLADDHLRHAGPEKRRDQQPARRQEPVEFQQPGAPLVGDVDEDRERVDQVVAAVRLRQRRSLLVHEAADRRITGPRAPPTFADPVWAGPRYPTAATGAASGSKSLLVCTFPLHRTPVCGVVPNPRPTAMPLPSKNPKNPACWGFVVGAPGFEPGTSPTRITRAPGATHEEIPANRSLHVSVQLVGGT